MCIPPRTCISENGDPDLKAKAELRRLAHRDMWHERADHTLQTSELINEAYVRLVDAGRVHTGRTARTFWPYPRRRCGECWSNMPVRTDPNAGVRVFGACRCQRR
jgi:ECF sigma factor